MMKKKEGQEEEETRDGTVDYYGRPSVRSNSGKWVAGIIILGMYLFSNHDLNRIKQKRTIKQNNIF